MERIKFFKRLRSRDGMSLIELMITGALISGMFIVISSMHVSALSLVARQRTVDGQRGNAFLASEEITRKISLCNFAALKSVGSQVDLRGDFDMNFQPRNTPADFTDDTWVCYRFLQNRLYFRVVSVNPLDMQESGVNISVNNEEVIPGLRIAVQGGQHFNLTNPSLQWVPQALAGNQVMVNVSFTSINTFATNTSIQTRIALGSQSK